MTEPSAALDAVTEPVVNGATGTEPVTEVDPATEPEPAPRRRMALRTRVTLLAAVAVGIAAALISGTAFLVIRQALYSDLDEQLQQRAYVVVRDPVVRQNQFQAVPAASLFATDLKVALILPSGQAYGIKNAPKPPFGQEELAVAAGRSDQSLRTVDDQRVLAVPAGADAALVLSQPLDPLRQTLGSLGLVLVLVGGAGVVLAAVAGAAVARTGLRPVTRLTAATERVATTGDLRPVPVSGDDELARLGVSFNRMLRAVAEAQDQQRRLVADAGHELRTPLTSLRTNLELLVASERPGAPPLSATDRSELHDDVRAQIEELSTLVGDLIELARDDTQQVAHEPVEMVDVVESALERARRRAGGVRFATELSAWSVTGDPTELERAVLNLLDNAVKWSPPDGVVRVWLRPLGDGTAVLEVADAGPGIAEADLPRVFDRFYRAEGARPMPGSGLGLAIVKQVADRYGGQVWAGRSAEGGALLVMRLPGVGATSGHS